MTLKAFTTEERHANLAAGNLVRLERAETRRAVERGERDVLALILDPPNCIAGMRAYDVIRWAPRVGAKKARRTCGMTGVGRKRLNELSATKRAEIVEFIRTRGWRKT